MSKLVRKFIFRITLLTVILAVTGASVFIFLIPNLYYDSFPILLVIFPIVSSYVHIRLLKASKKSLSKFNITFMLSFMLKLIVYVALAATIISLESDNRTSFVVTVLLLYLVYTIFDVKQALNDLKTMNNELKD